MQHKSDLLIIGTGLAGLMSALKLAPHFKINLLAKRAAMESNTRYAQGGIAAVMLDEDSFSQHIEDTMTAGCHLNKKSVVEKFVSQAPRLMEELIRQGIEFDRQASGALSLGQEGGHTHRRILHYGDATGLEIETKLLQRIKATPNITLWENHSAIDLICTQKLFPQVGNQCLGSYVLDQNTHEVHTFRADLTILATGGAGKVYLYTSNPDVATGDGFAMAYRAGCAMVNLEFVQFHPTTLYHPGAWVFTGETDRNKPKSFLISEAVRGEGAVLRRQDGSAFMSEYHELKDLAPRDIVARAIDHEMKKSGDDYLFLDFSAQSEAFIKTRFPNIYASCLNAGFNMSRAPIPIVPAAHYFCGGVQTSVTGRTGLPGLYALGEVAHTGLHGANRLASNSLLEALGMAVYGADEIRKTFAELPKFEKKIPDWNPGLATDSDELVVITQNWDEIRRLMWNYVGIVRSIKRLERAQRRIELLLDEIKDYYWNFHVTNDLLELRNIATVAQLVIESARQRKESRGLHYNKDFPALSAQPRDTVMTALTPP